MIGTIIIACFLLLVPNAFKKAGLKLLLEHKSEGLVLFIFSKVLWWLALAEIVLIWLPEQKWYVWGVAILGFVWKIFSDKKYVFLRYRKQSLQLEKKIKANP